MIYNNAKLHNVEELVQTENNNGYLLSRLPAHVREKVARGTAERSYCNCNCEIRFVLTGEKAEISLQRKQGLDVLPTGIAEIYYGNFQGDYKETPFIITNNPGKITIKKKDLSNLKNLAKDHNMSFDPEVIRVILPYDWPNYLIKLEGDIKPPKKEQLPEKKLLTYGSSITHGGSSVHSGESYAFQLAQLLDYDLINKGFAGNARMEAAMADYLAGLYWDIATLEMGINIIDDWSVEKYIQKIDYFISKIVNENPDKWVFCTDLFTNSRDYHYHEKIPFFREAVKEKVASINSAKVKYISGLELLTEPDGLSTDLVHPSSYGMTQIAGNFYRCIEDVLKSNKKF